MLTIEKIIFNIQQINNGSDSILVTEVRPLKKYVDGKSTEEIEGFRYLCILPANKYEQVSIKVENLTPAITSEELEAKGGTVKAKVKGFEGRFYKDSSSGEYRFTGKATAIEVVA